MTKKPKRKVVARRKTLREKTEKFFSCVTDEDKMEIDFLLNKGKAMDEIADELQKMGYFLHLSPRTVSDRLFHYKKTIYEPKILGTIENMDVYKRLLSMRDKLDTMDELRLLIIQQRDRVNSKLQLESVGERENQALNAALSNQTRKEVKLFGDLLEKLARLELETGVIKRTPRVISGTVDTDEEGRSTFKMLESYEEILETLDVESERVLESLDVDSPD